MRRVVACCVVLLGVLAALVPLGTSLRADWSILIYDEDGRVVGIRRGGGGDHAEQAPGSNLSRLPQGAGQGGPVRPEERYEQGELLVANPPEHFESTVRQLGFSIIEKVSLSTLAIRVYRLGIPRGATVPGAVGRLRGRFPGLAIDANHLFEPSAAEGSAESRARLVLGWPETPAGCGIGVRLGMIDGAVDLKHPALVGQNIAYRSFHSPSRRPGSAEHGTAIAAMLVGKGAWGGLLPAAQLKAANIFEVNDSGRAAANTLGLLRAVDWMVRERVHVINLSIAGAANLIMRRVFDKALNKGMVMVAAAGNWGTAEKPAFPAAYEAVLAVTAVSIDRIAYKHANRGRYIDFAAPGVRIWTAIPGGGRFQSGTSFATPYVTVLIALDIARGANRSPNTIRRTLRRHSIDLGAPGRDDIFGWGLVGMPRDCGN